MKIIALLPFKNEAWALPSYISSISKIADEIIALDDSSTDNSVGVLQNAGATLLTYDSTAEKVVNMSARRQILLEAGRKAGGTHFIWLDADETFSADFIPHAKEIITRLKPGQKLTMRWVNVWKNTTQYLDDKKSPFGYIWKDFIVFDTPDISFSNQFLSEARTQGPYGEPLILNESDGVVLHWQFARWEITQFKQARYRCLELIEGIRSAKRINHTYSISLDNKNLTTIPLPETWTKDICKPEINNLDINWYLDDLKNLFSKHGIEFFEPLQIWHIKELHQLFLEKTGREPKVEIFPTWLVYLNKIKNQILHA
jgi:glycosyltransferase involved in cell wall biosynthesis